MLIMIYCRTCDSSASLNVCNSWQALRRVTPPWVWGLSWVASLPRKVKRAWRPSPVLTVATCRETGADTIHVQVCTEMLRLRYKGKKGKVSYLTSTVRGQAGKGCLLSWANCNNANFEKSLIVQDRACNLSFRKHFLNRCHRTTHGINSVIGWEKMGQIRIKKGLCKERDHGDRAMHNMTKVERR